MTNPQPRALDPVVATAGRLQAALGNGCVQIALAGALRRRHRTAACIDFVAIPKIEPMGEGGAVNLLWAALDYFCDQPEHAGFLKRGEVLRSFKWRLVDGSGEIPVNVYTATPETLGLKLLVHTGPGEFWSHLVTKLYAAGYQPRDGALIRLCDGSTVPTPTELEVFLLAGIPPRQPWQRDSGAPRRGAW